MANDEGAQTRHRAAPLEDSAEAAPEDDPTEGAGLLPRTRNGDVPRLTRKHHRVLHFAGSMPMGERIVADYSFGSVKCGAHLFRWGLRVMLLFFGLYVLYGFYKMEQDPADSTFVHREEKLWRAAALGDAVQLPFIAVEGYNEPSVQVTAEMCDIPGGNVTRKTRVPTALRVCDVIQRHRTIRDASCIYEDGRELSRQPPSGILSVVGTFGDPLYRCATHSPRAPSTLRAPRHQLIQFLFRTRALQI